MLKSNKGEGRKRGYKKSNYSGKKKRHTIRAQITINTRGKILKVSKSYPGRVRDYNIFKQENTAEQLPKTCLKRM